LQDGHLFFVGGTALLEEHADGYPVTPFLRALPGHGAVRRRVALLVQAVHTLPKVVERVLWIEHDAGLQNVQHCRSPVLDGRHYHGLHVPQVAGKGTRHEGGLHGQRQCQRVDRSLQRPRRWRRRLGLEAERAGR